MNEETTIKQAADLRQSLEQFTGTSCYYRDTFVKFTDGVKYLADEAGAYWLITLIGSYQNRKLRQVPFQIWTLTVNEDHEAVVECREDTDAPVIVRQEIPYTDFPLDTIKLYCIDGIVLLPSEY